MIECSCCGGTFNADDTGEPYLAFKKLILCSPCYVGLVPKIYHMSGKGDGGLIHLVFQFCLTSHHNRRNRISLKANKELFLKLLHKYDFSCVYCGCSEIKRLTIDHIQPVSKGGNDEFSNLQILCKSCNSKKGAKF